MKTIKTIDINAKEWFDKINGNSYFAGIITLNFGMEDAKTIKMPFQYGYGDQYRHEAFNTMQETGVISDMNDREAIWQYCKRKKIILRTNIQTGCKKRDLINI